MKNKQGQNNRNQVHPRRRNSKQKQPRVNQGVPVDENIDIYPDDGVHVIFAEGYENDPNVLHVNDYQVQYRQQTHHPSQSAQPMNSIPQQSQPAQPHQQAQHQPQHLPHGAKQAPQAQTEQAAHAQQRVMIDHQPIVINGQKNVDPAILQQSVVRTIPAPIGKGIHAHKKTSKKPVIFALFLVLIVAAAIVFVSLFPWDRVVVLNGKDYDTKAHTTLAQLAETSGVKVTPGNLVAIDGTLLERGEGYPYSISVNGETVTDFNREINQGDNITISNGADKTEDITEEEIEITPPVTIVGSGSMHLLEGTGIPGKALLRTGDISKKTQEQTIEEPVAETMYQFNIDTGDDKVVALTFDDGPWATYTEEILNTLAEHGVKATFFTVGERISGLEETIARESAEGHQVSTHSWDHAKGSGQGVNLGYMTVEEQRAEFQQGLDIIEEVTGKPASTAIRVPGGNLNEETATILSEFGIAEIGWTIDTMDWKRPGVQSIYNQIMNVKPGGIILMHDGGGDRSQSVQALRDALPALLQEGYQFITIDELIEKYAIPQIANMIAEQAQAAAEENEAAEDTQENNA